MFFMLLFLGIQNAKYTRRETQVINYHKMFFKINVQILEKNDELGRFMNGIYKRSLFGRAKDLWALRETQALSGLAIRSLQNFQTWEIEVEIVQRFR